MKTMKSFKVNYLMLSLITLLLFINYSCKNSKFKDIEKSSNRFFQSTSGELQSLMDFYNQQTSGTILIEETHPLHEPHKIIDIFGNVFPDSISNVENVTVGDITIPNDGTGGFDTELVDPATDIYGKTVAVSLNPGFSDSFYIPQRINIQTNFDTIGPNKTFTWNGDANNTLGVLVMIRYDPGLQPQLDSNSRGSYIEHHCIVPDNGSFTLVDSLFTGLPNNAFVNLIVGRGNYKMIHSNENKRIKLEAYTASAPLLKYVK